MLVESRKDNIWRTKCRDVNHKSWVTKDQATAYELEIIIKVLMEENRSPKKSISSCRFGRPTEFLSGKDF